MPSNITKLKEIIRAVHCGNPLPKFRPIVRDLATIILEHERVLEPEAGHQAKPLSGGEQGEAAIRYLLHKRSELGDVKEQIISSSHYMASVVANSLSAYEQGFDHCIGELAGFYHIDHSIIDDWEQEESVAPHKLTLHD